MHLIIYYINLIINCYFNLKTNSCSLFVNGDLQTEYYFQSLKHIIYYKSILDKLYDVYVRTWIRG